MSKPPKIVIPGLNRGIGVPPGYVLGRMPGTGKGPAQLLNMGSLRKLGVAGAAGVAQSTSTAISTAHSETVSLKTSVSTSLSQFSSSLSGAVSSTGSLSTAVSTVISGSISAANSRIDSLSTAVGGGGGGGVDDDTALSTSLSSAVSINTIQSTSLSQISSSLSGAVSSTSSLSTAVSTVDSNQSTSLSQISSSLSAEISTDLSRINSLSTAVGGGGGGGGGTSAVIRSSNITSSSSTNFTVSFPAGAAVGDLVLIIAGGGFSFTVPTGWTYWDSLAGTNFNGIVISKVMTTNDINAGSVVLSSAGSFNAAIACICFTGAPTIKNISTSRNGAGAGSRSVTIAAGFTSTDYAIYFGFNRNASADTNSLGSAVQSVNAANASGVVTAATTGGTSVTNTVTYGTSSGTTGDYQGIVVLSG